MALILNPATGLVSPQFHVRFDPEFATAPDLKTQPSWKYLAGFIRGGTTPNRESRQKRRTQITQELPLHQNQKDVPNIDPPHQEGGEVNTNTLTPPYQGMPTPIQGSESKREDIAQPE